MRLPTDYNFTRQSLAPQHRGGSAAQRGLGNPLGNQPNANRAQTQTHPVIAALSNYAQAHAKRQAVNQQFKQALETLKAHLSEQVAQPPQVPNQAASLLPNLAQRTLSPTDTIGSVAQRVAPDRLPASAANLLPRIPTPRNRNIHTRPMRRALGPYQNF